MFISPLLSVIDLGEHSYLLHFTEEEAKAQKG